jgi:hypothetical protein
MPLPVVFFASDAADTAGADEGALANIKGLTPPVFSGDHAMAEGTAHIRRLFLDLKDTYPTPKPPSLMLSDDCSPQQKRDALRLVSFLHCPPSPSRDSEDRHSSKRRRLMTGGVKSESRSEGMMSSARQSLRMTVRVGTFRPFST